MSELNIYQRLNKVMKAVEYIQKDANVSGYMAVSHDQVISVTRKHFVEHGIIVQAIQESGEVLVNRDLDAKTPIKMLLYTGTYEIRFVNIDKPEDWASIHVQAHANDNGDKAPGKAITYATKTAMLKILSLETGVNDESRTFEATLYRPEEKDELDRILAEEDHIGSVVMQQTYNVDVQAALFSSFEKGQITKNKTKLRELQAAGWDFFKGLAQTIKSADRNDSEVSEAIDELETPEKKILMGLLDDNDVEYLKGLKDESQTS